MKTNSHFNLKKTAKRLLATELNPEARRTLKTALIAAQVAFETRPVHKEKGAKEEA